MKTAMTRAPLARLVIGILSLILVLGLTWSLYWFIGAGRARQQVRGLTADLQLAQNPFTCGTQDWGGYPFYFSMSCSKPNYKISEAAPLSASHLSVNIPAYWPSRVQLSVDGPVILGPVTFTIQPVHLVFQPGTAKDFTLWGEGSDLRMTPEASAHDLQFEVRRQSDQLWLDVSATDLSLRTPKGGNVTFKRVDLEAESKALLLDEEDPLAWLVQTSAPLQITALKADLGSATVMAHGEVALDQEGHMTGKIMTEIDDFDAFFAFVAASVPLSGKQASAARTLINLLGSQGKGQSKEILVTLNAGEVYWGPFKIATLPPLPQSIRHPTQ